MTLLQQGGATVATYVYNAAASRIAKTVGAVTTRFAYGPGGLLGEYGATSRDYVWMDDTPVAVVDGAGLAFVHADGLDSPRAITNAAGTVVWSWAYQNNPFGELPPASTQGYVFNLRFAGQYYDAEDGLVYNQYRYFDATVGRYMQSDPVGLIAGMSTYAYVDANPLSRVDPLGLWALTHDQQAAITAAAQDWSASQVPYVFGGSSKQGADCSGSVSAIFNQAGIPLGRKQSQQFKQSPFEPIVPGSALEIGDVGVYPGHVVIYGGDTGGGKDVWSASHTNGPKFGPARSEWYGTPVWYRYNGP